MRWSTLLFAVFVAGLLLPTGPAKAETAARTLSPYFFVQGGEGYQRTG